MRKTARFFRYWLVYFMNNPSFLGLISCNLDKANLSVFLIDFQFFLTEFVSNVSKFSEIVVFGSD